LSFVLFLRAARVQRHALCGGRRRRRTLPPPLPRSVSPPAPLTSILIVPLGPKLVFMTSSRPLAALMFMKRAAVCPIVSARGLSVLTLMIALFSSRYLLFLSLCARTRRSGRGLLEGSVEIGLPGKGWGARERGKRAGALGADGRRKDVSPLSKENDTRKR